MSPDARDPAADGDHSRFASFFEANRESVQRVIRRLGVPEADIENVEQDSWLSLLTYWKKRGAPETAEHARNLLFQIIRSRVRDYWRRAGRQPRTETWDPEVHDRPDWSSAEQCDGIVEFLTKHDTRPGLTSRQQTALRLVQLEGWTQQEAAALMGITPNSMEKLLFRAKKAIQQAQQTSHTRTEEGTR